jgi:hypothetical protein
MISIQCNGGFTLNKNIFSGIRIIVGLLFTMLAMTMSTAALADSPNCNGGPNGSQNIVVHLQEKHRRPPSGHYICTSGQSYGR